MNDPNSPLQRKRNPLIGVFDSGVGGLALLTKLRGARPGYDYVYLADTAWAPYGPLPPERIVERSLLVGRWLCAQGAQTLVVACNTASAWALEALRREVHVPVVGVLEATRRAALRQADPERTVVWATAATARSGAYAWAGLVRPTPLLAPLVEAGHLEDKVATVVLEDHLEQLPPGTRTLVLGCTHYSFLIPLLTRLAPWLRVVDSAQATAEALAARLAERDGRGEVRQFVSGELAPYRTALERLGMAHERPEAVEIDLPHHDYGPGRQGFDPLEALAEAAL